MTIGSPFPPDMEFELGKTIGYNYNEDGDKTGMLFTLHYKYNEDGWDLNVFDIEVVGDASEYEILWALEEEFPKHKISITK